MQNVVKLVIEYIKKITIKNIIRMTTEMELLHISR